MKNQRTRQKKTMSKIEIIGKAIGNLITFISVLFLLWLTISFFDVNLHNTYPGGVDDMLPWNAFKLFVAYCG